MHCWVKLPLEIRPLEMGHWWFWHFWHWWCPFPDTSGAERMRRERLSSEMGVYRFVWVGRGTHRWCLCAHTHAGEQWRGKSEPKSWGERVRSGDVLAGSFCCSTSLLCFMIQLSLLVISLIQRRCIRHCSLYKCHLAVFSKWPVMAAHKQAFTTSTSVLRSWTKWSLGLYPMDVIHLSKPLGWAGAQSGALITCLELFWRNTSYLLNW